MTVFPKSALAIALTLTTALGGVSAPAAPVAAAYDPLALTDGPAAIQATAPTTPGFHDLTVHDAARTRDIPVRVYLPASADHAPAPAPVILFSHGLGGARTNNPYLGEHWSARGYAVVYLQHAGSDESVWQDEKPWQRMRAMKKAASGKNHKLRLDDVPAVLDQLERWNDGEQDTAIAHRLDLDRVGMCGHSFGAVTTQNLSGQSAFGGKLNVTDPRIDAALPMSPSVPRLGDPTRAFADVQIPWLLMTGTHDEGVIGGATSESRRKVFPALPAGSKYELVLNDAEHNAFGDRALPGETLPRNPNHHRVILALSTAFWDAYLRDAPEARAWLDGPEPRSVMDAEDAWQRK